MFTPKLIVLVALLFLVEAQNNAQRGFRLADRLPMRRPVITPGFRPGVPISPVKEVPEVVTEPYASEIPPVPSVSRQPIQRPSIAPTSTTRENVIVPRLIPQAPISPTESVVKVTSENPVTPEVIDVKSEAEKPGFTIIFTDNYTKRPIFATTAKPIQDGNSVSSSTISTEKKKGSYTIIIVKNDDPDSNQNGVTTVNPSQQPVTEPEIPTDKPNVNEQTTPPSKRPVVTPVPSTAAVSVTSPSTAYTTTRRIPTRPPLGRLTTVPSSRPPTTISVATTESVFTDPPVTRFPTRPSSIAPTTIPTTTRRIPTRPPFGRLTTVPSSTAYTTTSVATTERTTTSAPTTTSTTTTRWTSTRPPFSRATTVPSTIGSTTIYTPTTWETTTVVQTKPTPSPTNKIRLYNYNCRNINGYYSVINKCEEYIQCTNNEAYQITCPNGLLYNSAVKWPAFPCGYPSEVTCRNQSVTPRPIPSGDCSDRNGYFPIPSSDCGQFKVCQDGVVIAIMDCPSGLAFNPSTSTCDWPVNVPGCNPNVFEGFTCPARSVDSFGHSEIINYRYKASCKNYIACHDGRPRFLSCDPGFSFDEEKATCVNSSLVRNCNN